ncbi:conserved hypothetical protein [Culex quinquefasciatus]|uniref:WW domain-containing protein n=1 Tax=Culex quinquefasciatus TaxID=7176 RepID=B0XF57_CULQU|nr:conserved hypothetical protein [Culex quinquefasciatus]|eukprot:XP_001868279.1 conserved hypothetical protein [Culex quinquefasciatus]
MAAAAKADSDWTVHKTKDGKPFYWNKVTQESVWKKPDGFQEEKQPLTDKEVENSDPPTPRVRKYQDAPGERWQVFFRPKHKPLRSDGCHQTPPEQAPRYCQQPEGSQRNRLRSAVLH